jgi:ankyrin repeat protein
MNKALTLILALTISLPASPKNPRPTTQEVVFINAAKTGHLSELIEYLNAGFNPDITDETGMTALMYAAEKNHPEVVKLLIKNGADIEACHYRATALVYAVFNGNIACVRALLDAKAKTDICLRFNGDQGILHLVQKDNPEILQMLIQAGAPLNQTDDGGHTPLLWAVLQKDLTSLTILLNAGANPNLVLANLFGFTPITPLMAAANSGFIEGVKALLNAKADISIKDKRGKTALDYAATEEIKILLQTT